MSIFNLFVDIGMFLLGFLSIKLFLYHTIQTSLAYWCGLLSMMLIASNNNASSPLAWHPTSSYRQDILHHLQVEFCVEYNYYIHGIIMAFELNKGLFATTGIRNVRAIQHLTSYSDIAEIV